MIITDGKPSGEKREKLRDTLQSCKESPALQKYGSSAAVFLISQVGKDAEARKFLDELRKDGSINGMVYCSAYTLDDQQAVFKQGDGRKGYTAWLIELFLAVLEPQTT